MASTLSLRSFGYRLKKAKSISPNKLIVPNGIPKELGKKFLRVMMCTDMSEISDVTDDDIIFMHQHGAELAGMIDQDTLLAEDGPLRTKLTRMRSAVKRRVL